MSHIHHINYVSHMQALYVTKSLLLLRIALSVINYCCNKNTADKRNLTPQHNGGPTSRTSIPPTSTSSVVELVQLRLGHHYKDATAMNTLAFAYKWAFNRTLVSAMTRFCLWTECDVTSAWASKLILVTIKI